MKVIKENFEINDGYKATVTIYEDESSKVEEHDLGLVLFFNSKETLERHLSQHLQWCNIEAEQQIEERRLGFSIKPSVYILGDKRF